MPPGASAAGARPAPTPAFSKGIAPPFSEPENAFLARSFAPRRSLRPEGRATEARSRYEKGLLRAGIEPYSKHPSKTRPYAACPPPSGKRAGCLGVVAPKPGRLAAAGLPKPGYEGSGKGGGFSPEDLRSAYKLPAEGGEGLTVAITIAYHDPKAESDLAVYRETYGLPPCTTANGCFRKVNQRGEQRNYPTTNAGWAVETSLDLDMVSATCPQCHILLVEADSNYDKDLGVAVDKAAEMGAAVISDSWAGGQFPEETSFNHYWDHPGVPVLFASGDWGYGVYYPTASPDVVAVGGTSLRKAKDAREWTETVWEGAGSGCSKYEEKPAWQSDEGCTRRTVADVSAVSDPETPVSMYDSFEYEGWLLVGGTSVATPLLAGVEGLSSAEFRAEGPAAFTRTGEDGGLFDVTEGANGSCGSYLCQGEAGYDGPTGWGTPNGPLSLPVAITEKANVLSTTEATLKGSIDPKGIATEYRFEYGETTEYGEAIPVPDESAGQGSGYLPVSQTITGLKSHTTYHYRVVATNEKGTFHGQDRIFITTPPQATTGAASEVHANDATLNATVNPEGIATAYSFEYGTTTSYGTTIPTPPGNIGSGTEAVAVSEPAGNLVPNQTYHFRVVARTAFGNSYGKDATFTTAPSEWSAEHTPWPENAIFNWLTDISCPSQRWCMATGRTPWGEGFSVQWDGREWRVEQYAEGPQAEPIWAPEHVSCASRDWCVAVSSYADWKTGYWKPVAEHWDGEKWNLDSPLPLPAETTESWPYDVSCSSSTACMAVGFRDGTDAYGEEHRYLLVERWNGTSWSQTGASPSKLTGGELYSVSCAASSDCVAVGWYETLESGKWALARRWRSGQGWTTIQQTQPPAPRGLPYLEDVSCPAPEDCTAVGVLDETPGSDLERWNGTSWSAQSLPKPVGSEAVYVALSCPDTDTCTAAGSSETPTSETGSVPVAYRRQGDQWSLQSTAEPTGEQEGSLGSGSALFGVSCPAASWCTAVGYYLGQSTGAPTGMAERWSAPGPGATTEPATNAGFAEATLHATVNPGGSETTYQLQYGTSRAYGTSVPTSPEAIGSGTEDVALARRLSGLSAGTTYHFRVEATNSEGTTYGEDQSFTTRPAAAPHYFLSFAQAGSGNGQLAEPRGAAIDPEGDLWVADTANSRLEEFNPEGEYLRSSGKEGSGPGQFGKGSPHGVAIDSEGNLWATDTANNRIEEFNSKGEYLAQIGEAGAGEGQLDHPQGLAIDAKGNLWVADTNNKRIEELGAKGEYLGQIATAAGPDGIALDPAGNLWVAEPGADRIAKFDPAGKELLSVGSGKGSGQGQFNTPSGLATDSEANVWVADSENDRVQILDSQGKYITQFGTAGTGSGQLDFPSAVALGPGDAVSVLDSRNDRAQQWTYGPLATTKAATSVTINGATLNASVTPEGLDTAYRFQYGSDRSYGQSIPLSPTRAGFGTSAISVKQALGGLKGGMTYHFRVVASNAQGTTYGKDLTLSTPHVAATAETAAEVTTTGALLRATVTPQGFDTTYRFEYGKTTSYGTSVPVPAQDIGSGTEAVKVSQQISGLSPETTYHFRIRADAGGETVRGTDEVFTTKTTLQWLIEQAPEPGAQAGSLTDVSCSSADACMALAGSGAKFTNRWDGMRWSVVPLTATGLLAVSCPAEEFCMAVGKSGAEALAERWNGKEWSVLPTPNPANAQLSGVSCPSGEFCMAVGWKYGEAIAERWDGEGWSVLPTPKEGSWESQMLKDVSCNAPASCTAVGFYEIFTPPAEGEGQYLSLAEHWDGTSWTVQATPNPAGTGADTVLYGVSCSGAAGPETRCVAVGASEPLFESPVPVAERFDGKAWSLTALPDLSEEMQDASLESVSCASATSCVAVGAFSPGSHEAPLAARWNGSGWSVQGAADPVGQLEGATKGSLRGISCLSSSVCKSVGQYSTASGTFTLAERYRMSPPAVTTEAASEVGDAKATLNGTVNPQGIKTTYRFEYDTAEYKEGEGSHGTSIPVPDEAAGSGSQGVKVSEAISGLEETTTYHFRLVATNVEGSTFGADRSFRTRGLPPAAVTEGTTDIEAGKATLHGKVDPEGSATHYRFEWGSEAEFKEGRYRHLAPAPDASAGSGRAWVPVEAQIEGLAGEGTYHYRLVAESSEGRTLGEDGSLRTPDWRGFELGAMAVGQPFDASSASLADFEANWSALGWDAGKGTDTSLGWYPANISAGEGVYFAPQMTDTGAGIAAATTMAGGPAEGRYLSLWLDMPSPSAGTRSGYELRFTKVAGGVYDVALSKWEGGSQTVLASQSGYAFANGSSLAVVDEGATVSAWTDTGSGFSQLLSAGDASFTAGDAGVEGLGILSPRLANFRAGPLASPVASMDAALESLPVDDSFEREEDPLSDSGAWSALAWDNSTSGHNTGTVSGGWGPYDSSPAINGAYWQKAGFAGSGSGDAVAATLKKAPASNGDYLSLWLNAPNPASIRSGYELRLTRASAGVYEAALSKWQSGAKTALAQKSGYAFPTGSQLALVDKAGTVSAWTKTGSAYTQLLSASDSTYIGGYSGVEGLGNATRLTDFEGGPLVPRSNASAVLTEGTTEVTGGKATLHGKVDPEGSLTHYRFEWGSEAEFKEGKYGHSTTAQNAGSGEAWVAVERQITGLAGTSTYHYRLIAESIPAKTTGEDGSFTTPARPPGAVTEGTSGITVGKATLHGKVDPEGAATHYRFEWGSEAEFKEGKYGHLAPAEDASAGSGESWVSVEAQIEGLAELSTYHYRLVAESAQGRTVGEDKSLTTPDWTALRLAAMAITNPFDGGSSSLADFNANWAALGWSGAGGTYKGSDTTTGWASLHSYPTVDGAYYKPVPTDVGLGLAAVATMGANPYTEGRYFSLWLDTPSPSASARAGYELRFTYISSNNFNVALSRWQGGSQTTLATKSSYAFATGKSLALVDRGETVSAWTDTGSGFSQLLSAADASFSGGNAGLEAGGSRSRLTNFKAGALLDP